MSDILIKGMEMPKTMSILAVFPNGYVAVYDSKDTFIGEAKAVPVPPHFGDLIDRAMLIDSFEPSDFWNSSAEDNCFAAIHITNSMPAIIPAEEKS